MAVGKRCFRVLYKIPIKSPYSLIHLLPKSFFQARFYSSTQEKNEKNPMFGLGCYNLEKDKTERAVLTALEAGYRLFDTAQSYGNEKDIGVAIKKSGIQRNKIYLATKLSDKHGYEAAYKSLRESLDNLQVDYIDLYLIHSPSKGHILETWAAFQELQEKGLVKRIGVSNFNIHHLEGLIKASNSVPQVNQIEHHPWHQQRELVQYCRDKGIKVMGYCPLARMKMISKTNDNVLNDIAIKYNKQVSQILLRWSIQKNVITIPKSFVPQRIKDNIQIFDFALSDEDMKCINLLDCEHQIASIKEIHEPWTG